MIIPAFFGRFSAFQRLLKAHPKKAVPMDKLLSRRRNVQKSEVIFEKIGWKFSPRAEKANFLVEIRYRDCSARPPDHVFSLRHFLPGLLRYILL